MRLCLCQKDAVRCFAFGTLHYSTGVFGRATHVFKVLILGNAEDGTNNIICTLKDSWQQRCRLDEAYFYKAIKMRSQAPKTKQELLQTALTLHNCQPGDVMDCVADNLGSWNMKDNTDSNRHGFITQSAILRVHKNDTLILKDPTILDRDRVRSLTRQVGRPLTTFRNTKELISTLKNAVGGEFYPRC